jgi:hypothetical protein
MTRPRTRVLSARSVMISTRGSARIPRSRSLLHGGQHSAFRPVTGSRNPNAMAVQRYDIRDLGGEFVHDALHLGTHEDASWHSPPDCSSKGKRRRGQTRHQHLLWQRKPVAKSRSEKTPTLNVQCARNSLSQCPTRVTSAANLRNSRHNFAL